MSEALQTQSELNLLLRVINLSFAPYLIKDADDGSRYLRCNQAFADLLGREKKDILGHTDEELFDAEWAGIVRRHDEEVLATDGPVTYEDDGYITRDGIRRRFVRQKRMFLGDNGHRLIFCAGQDITASYRRTAAESFKAEVSSFIVQNGSHDELIEFVAKRLLDYFQCQHVLLLRADGSRRDWCQEAPNGKRHCLVCADCPMREMDVSAFGEANLLKIDDVAACAALQLPKACPNKSILAMQIIIEGRPWGRLAVFRTERAQRFIEIDEEVLRHAADIIALSFQRSRSIEELSRKNAELVEERDRAVAAERAKSYFFSTVSHDIRTPLNAIIGFSQLLKLGVRNVKERERVIDSIVVSGKTLLQLINDVLDLSKLEAGRMEILPDPTDCQRLVREIVESFRVANRNKSVEVRGVTGPMPTLLLDAQRVRQILFNLVGNAMKFTKKGFVEVRANYEAETEKLSFEVQDTGCGITEEDMRKIASPYVQVGERGGRNGGTGLGLAICRQLVTAMNGEIELASHFGKGTTFYVILNGVKNGEKARRERLSATQQMKVSVPAALAKNVSSALLVDDSAMNLNVLKAMLARFNLKDVATAGNGLEALKKLRERPFDVVLTDLWMPQMDGEVFVREVRKNPAWAALPVYAVTADVEAQHSVADAGFTDVLLKPLTFEKLRMLFA